MLADAERYGPTPAFLPCANLRLFMRLCGKQFRPASIEPGIEYLLCNADGGRQLSPDVAGQCHRLGVIIIKTQVARLSDAAPFAGTTRPL